MALVIQEHELTGVCFGYPATRDRPKPTSGLAQTDWARAGLGRTSSQALTQWPSGLVCTQYDTILHTNHACIPVPEGQRGKSVRRSSFQPAMAHDQTPLPRHRRACHRNSSSHLHNQGLLQPSRQTQNLRQGWVCSEGSRRGSNCDDGQGRVVHFVPQPELSHRAAGEFSQ